MIRWTLYLTIKDVVMCRLKADQAELLKAFLKVYEDDFEGWTVEPLVREELSEGPR